MTPQSSSLRWYGLGLLAAVLAVIAHNALRFPGTDFGVYYRAGARFIAGLDLYTLGHGYARYRYAPGAAGAFAALSLLPYGVAKSAWIALSMAIAIGVSVWVQRRVSPRRWFAVPLAWACLFHPVAQELQLGQMHMLVLGLLVAAFTLEDRGHAFSAGVLVAFASSLKIVPILFVGEALLRRKWHVGIGFVTGVAAVAAIPTLRYGWSGAVAQHAAWLQGQQGFTAELLRHGMNQSIFGIFYGLGIGILGGLLAALGIAVLALSVRPLDARRTLCLAAMVLISPNGWVQGFVLAAPMTAFLMAGRSTFALLGAGLALGTGVLAYDALGPAGEAWALSRHLLGMDMLALFVLARCADARGALPCNSSPGEA